MKTILGFLGESIFLKSGFIAAERSPSYKVTKLPLSHWLCVSLMGKLLGLLGKPYATMYLQMRLLNPACKRVYKVLSC